MAVSEAGSFAEGKELLRARRPHVLITQIRLADYNGMQLAHWGRVRAPTLRSVLIGGSDPHLEWEARTACFLFLRYDDERAVVQGAQEALLREVPRRCWHRKILIPHVSAHIDGSPAYIVDISYGGFRARLGAQPTVEASRPLAVAITSLGTERETVCQWVRVLPTTERLCGASVGDADKGSGSQWRALVDALPNALLRPE